MERGTTIRSSSQPDGATAEKLFDAAKCLTARGVGKLMGGYTKQFLLEPFALGKYTTI
jgi:hypothetical protein